MNKSVEELLSQTDSSVHSIMDNTKARFNAILRSAIKKSDATKGQNLQISSNKNSRNSLVTTTTFTSQQNLISSDYDSNKIASETTVRKSLRRRKKSKVRKIPDTSDNSLSEGKQSPDVFETEYEKPKSTKSRGKLFRAENVSTESQIIEVQDQGKPVPKPRLTKSEGVFELPIPKARSIYRQVQEGGKQTQKEVDDVTSDMTSVDTTPRLLSAFHSPNITYTKNNPENVDGIRSVEHTRGPVPQFAERRHNSRRRSSITDNSKHIAEIIEMKEFKKRKFRKSKESIVATNIETTEICSEKTDEVTDDKVIGVYIHEIAWIRNQEKLLRSMLCPFVTAYIVFERNALNPISESLNTKCWSSSSESFRPPKWEELLIFEHDFNEIKSPNVVLMFEILDVNIISTNNDFQYNCIAWAFLKPIGSNGATNTHTKVRLQLFKPKNVQAQGDSNRHYAYEWWKSSKREKFPGTLSVTINSLRQKECLPTSTDLSEKSSQNQCVAPQVERLWSRLPGQMCKLPNSILSTVCQGIKGCLVVKFSRNGRLLACATTKDNAFFIYVYKIPEVTEIAVLLGHQGLIYDLCWSYDDSILLSASADLTVSVWDMRRLQSSTQLLQFLPHPSFVYGVSITEDDLIVASSCYDKIVRLWTRDSNIEEFYLSQELEGHSGYVTAVCFGKNCLFSGDSDGLLIEWTPTETAWVKNRILCSSELRNSIVSRISLHPSGRRILVHSRNSILRIIDIQTGVATQWLKSSLNNKMQISSCFTPCGSMVFAGGEDGQVSIWDSLTGIRRAIYIPSTLPLGGAIAAVDYHPLDHMMAISSFGARSKVLICQHKQSTIKCNELGLQIFQVNEILNSDRGVKEEKEKPSVKLKTIINNLNATSIEEINSGNNRKPIKLATLIEKIDGILKPVTQSSNNLQRIEKPSNDKDNLNENKKNLVKIYENERKNVEKYNESISSRSDQTYGRDNTDNTKIYSYRSSKTSYDSDDVYSVVNFKLNLSQIRSSDTSESCKNVRNVIDHTYSINEEKESCHDESSSNVESLPTDSMPPSNANDHKKVSRNLKVKADVHTRST